MNNDIYTTDEHARSDRSTRYIVVEVRHVTGILNRIVSLMRRKRFNIEELKVVFDKKNSRAEITLAMDALAHDIHHVIQQIRKLHDVFMVREASGPEKR